MPVSLPVSSAVGAQLLARVLLFRAAGGRGSGNFGHSGRPGEIGGSASSGFEAAGPQHAERLKALRIPPAWKNVRVNPDPNGELQAIGTDVKGRTQYRYSAEHSELAAAEKFDRLKAFNAQLPALRERLDQDLKSADPKEREAAAVLKLIDKTGFRIGSDTDTMAEKQATGASTLEASHVRIVGDKVSFDFVGKKGVDISKVVEDKELADMLRPRVSAGGRLFDTTDANVRDYMHAKAPGFTPKDFRTHNGTRMALEALTKVKIPASEKEFKAAQQAVAKIVAAHLGNTPTVALASYIDPSVFSKWRVASSRKIA